MRDCSEGLRVDCVVRYLKLEPR